MTDSKKLANEKSKLNLKQIASRFLQVILGIILLLGGLILWGEFNNVYTSNHKYSIAMPKINGHFDILNDHISILGLNNIVDDDIATLTYSEFFCEPTLKYCSENRITISGWGDSTMLVPANEKYKIKYADKNKIIISDNYNVTGEIDLNLKTLTFTQKNVGFEHNETRKIEIITDNKKIEELEKKIIRKYLKKEWFK